MPLFSTRRQTADAPKPSLRERLAATKARAADIGKRATLAVKVGRVVLSPSTPAPAPAPQPVDRVALINYASWLFMERRLVLLELYSNAGAEAEGFVAAALGADRFHFPNDGRSWRDVPQPSARAVRILDLVGVDWRSDAVRAHSFDPEFFDAPALPGWPALDGEILTALADLRRLDAAIDALAPDDDRDMSDVPGYDALDAARNAVFAILTDSRARSLPGLQAKARALQDTGVRHFAEPAATIARSLARDLLSTSRREIEPRPDPIHAAIEEGRRLMRSPAFDLPDVGRDPHPDRDEAQDATWAHFREAIAETVPTAARGCAALARYVIEFRRFQGVDLDDEMATVLANIARSPLL